MKLLLQLLLPTLLLPLLLQLPVALATYGIPDEYQPDNVAESWAEQTDTYTGDDYGSTAVTYILSDLISGLLGIVGVIAVYFLVSNGLAYATSFGQQDKIDKAKKGIMWSIGGLFIILISYSIVKFIIRIILTVDEPTLDGATSMVTRLIT